MKLLLGHNIESGEKRFLSSKSLATHMHLVGATGTGKSTALLQLMRRLLLTPEKCGMFLIDPMGNLSRDLMNFLAHPHFCPASVRDRLVYIEPAREDVVASLNPLKHSSDSNRYYQVTRAMDIVLRAWNAQDLSQQPRLAQWMYNAFYSAAAIGIPITMCRYLLTPGSPEHDAIISRIPEMYRVDWQEAMRNKNEASRILESTRNRLRPFFDSPNLVRMFGSNSSRLDCRRFIRERKIVIVNLGRYSHGGAASLADRDSDTIGGMVLNEIMEAAHAVSLQDGRRAIEPTYVVMDEFQNFVSPDIERALPTVRQLGLRLILVHQSFHQLEQSEVDLTQMIWQARSRLVFANSATDADIVADELAKLTFRGDMLKDVRMAAKQRIADQRVIWLESESNSNSTSTSMTSSTGENDGSGQSKNLSPESFPTKSENQGTTRQQSTAQADVIGYSNGRHQTLQTVYEDFEEEVGRTYVNFEEWALKWGRDVRSAGLGEAFLTTPESSTPEKIKVKHFEIPEHSEAVERRETLIEKNFASDVFVSAAEADRELEEHRVQLLTDRVHIGSSGGSGNKDVIAETETDGEAETEASIPFEL